MRYRVKTFYAREGTYPKLDEVFNNHIKALEDANSDSYIIVKDIKELNIKDSYMIIYAIAERDSSNNKEMHQVKESSGLFDNRERTI